MIEGVITTFTELVPELRWIEFCIRPTSSHSQVGSRSWEEAGTRNLALCEVNMRASRFVEPLSGTIQMLHVVTVPLGRVVDKPEV